MKKWLKPGGRLLFAVDNRFGLRYYCEDILKVPERDRRLIICSYYYREILDFSAIGF